MKFDGLALLGYQLNDIEQHSNTTIPVTPKALEQWLADLPLLNTNQLAQDIPQYIQQLNQIHIVDKQRFQMLERLRQVVDHIYQVLSKRIRGANLELSDEFQEILWILNVLLGEMALGYQRLLYNKANHHPGWFNRKSYTVLAERVSYYLSERILLAYQFCSVVSDNVWLDLNSTWQYVQKFHLADRTIQDEYAFYPKKTGTIATIYKRIVLLSMVSPYSLRSAELEQLYFGLIPWIDEIKLRKADDPVKTGFYISLMQDQGACFIDTQTVSDEYLYIDTDVLQKKLLDWLNTGHAPECAQYKGMTNKLLEEVITKLSGRLRRQSERIANPGEQIEGVIGLHNIDELLQTMQQSSVDEGMISPVEASLSQFLIDEDWERRGEESEWNGLHYYSPEQQYLKQSKQSEPQQYSLSVNEVKRHVFTIINESETGVCLSCQGLNDEGLFIGQLLFMRGYDASKWTLGIVRWMCHDNNKLNMGLHLLSANVERVTINKQDMHQQKELHVLRLGEGKYEDSLLLPRTEFEIGEELQLEHNGKFFDIILSEVVWHSEGYAQFCYKTQ